MEKLSRILHDLDQGNINVELAKQQVLDLFDVNQSIISDEAYTKCNRCGKKRMIGTMCIDPKTGECDNVG